MASCIKILCTVQAALLILIENMPTVSAKSVVVSLRVLKSLDCALVESRIAASIQKALIR